MKKAQTIRFRLEAKDLPTKKLLTFYKDLIKKRSLKRFCREAFIEKAERQLSGLDSTFEQLQTFIQTKGFEYVLEAIQSKESGLTKGIDESALDKVADKIILSLKNNVQKEPYPITPLHPVENKIHVAADKKSIAIMNEHKDELQKPDIEKLKAFL